MAIMEITHGMSFFYSNLRQKGQHSIMLAPLWNHWEDCDI